MILLEKGYSQEKPLVFPDIFSTFLTEKHYPSYISTSTNQVMKCIMFILY